MVYLSSDFWAQVGGFFTRLVRGQMPEVVVFGGAAAVLILALWALLRLRRRRRFTGSSAATPEKQGTRLVRPSKEDILNAVVEFDAYPSFIRILTEVLDHFSMEYLYSYGELSQAMARLLDFPEGAGRVSPTQRASMVTMVRVFMTSDFIRNKCHATLEDNFDKFMKEAGSAS